MNNIFKALIAGYGAKKLGGGCFGTILVFVIIWVLLGQCGAAPAVSNADVQLKSGLKVYDHCMNPGEPAEVTVPQQAVFAPMF